MNHTTTNCMTTLGGALLCAALAAPIASQASSAPAHQVTGILLLRCGASDITLNAALIEALLSQPGIREPFRKEFGDAFTKLDAIGVEFEGGHAKGTYQINIECRAQIGGEWSTKKAQACKRTIADYLKPRLNDMLYRRPRADLSEQREGLHVRMVQLQTQLAELEAHDSSYQLDLDRLRERSGTLMHQMLEAELDAATEEHARDHLAKMRAQNIELRDQLRTSIATTDRERDNIQAALRPIRHRLAMLEAPQRPKATPQEPSAASLRKQAADLDKALAKLQDSRSQWEEIQGDVNSLLTIVLERLPACELALQRARARLLSLQERLDETRAQTREIASQFKKNSQRVIARRRAEIDLQVARERMLELEAQLARMQPVRYELLD